MENLNHFGSVNQDRHLNNVDPDETAHNEPSHQDLHRLTFWTQLFKAYDVVS